MTNRDFDDPTLCSWIIAPTLGPASTISDAEFAKLVAEIDQFSAELRQ